MQDIHQPHATLLDSQSSGITDPDLDLDSVNRHGTFQNAASSSTISSKYICPVAASDAQTPSFPPSIVPEVREDDADLDIDDTNIISSSARASPALILDTALPSPQNPPDDSEHQTQYPIVCDIANLQKSDSKSDHSIKQRRTSASSSSKSEALHNKKRTFSLKEHMKETDTHPSDEETAHSFKWITLKRPRQFSIVEVENQPPLLTPKFTFVDLMNAAPHLAATVQRNVAISIASDILQRKGTDTKNNTNLSSKSHSGNYGPHVANTAKIHPAKKSDPSCIKIEEQPAVLPMHGNSDIQKSLLARTVISDKLDPHIPAKKRRSKFSSALAASHPPKAPASNMGVVAGPHVRERVVPKTPSSSAINATLSKKLVRSATHVYIANYINEMRKAQEALKKIQEKQQQQLRQQQEQRVQQNRLQQQQQHLQQQMHNQQQMMQLFSRSQQGQATQPQDTFLSQAGAALRHPFNSMPPPTSNSKASTQRSKSTSAALQSAALLGGTGSYSNPNLSYMMIPSTSGQRPYASSTPSQLAMGYPPPSYSAQAQAQYHNQYLAMQQMTQMNSMTQQHHFARPSPPSRNPSLTATGLPYPSIGYSTAPYMFGSPAGLSSGVAMASSPHADFNASRQHNLQEQMKMYQQNEKKNIQNQLQSQLIQQVLTAPDPSGRLTKLSPRISPNSPQVASSSASGCQSLLVSEHQVINVDDDSKSP